MTWTEFDLACMSRALELAEQGRGQVAPNPPVGCVLVREGRIIAEGWHDHLGDLHGEQAAIADAESRGELTEGATAYVTLEPCNHFGRTPPCTQALLWAGVSEVVVATEDPNPTVRGQGIAVLTEAGIPVRLGCMGDAARRQMQSFMHWCERRLPLVTLKVAMDAVGVVDARDARPARFTSAASLDAAHRLRRNCGAIVVGVNTVIRDDPSLTVRRVELGHGTHPLRVILDRTLRIPETAKVLTDGLPTLLVHTEGDAERARGLASDAVEVVQLPDGAGGADLEALLAHLGDREVQELLVEGGPHVWQAFLAAGHVDRAILIRAPMELGAGPESGITAEGLAAQRILPCGGADWEGDSASFYTREGLEWPAQNSP